MHPAPEVPIDTQEKFVLFVQEHWVILLRPIFLYFTGLFLSGVLFWLGLVLKDFNHELFLGVLLLSYLGLLVVHHWLFMFMFSLELSGWAITTKRLIDFQFLPYVKHDMNYINIANITESEKHQEGLIKNTLHYGDILLNLSASRQSICFKYVPYPGVFVETLSRLQKQEAVEHNE